MYLLTLMLFFNLLSLFALLNRVTGKSGGLPRIGKISYAILLLLIAVVVYIFLVRKKKYITAELNERKGFNVKTADWIAALYIILSVFVFFGMALV
jgi:hypothetical protein